ncbi:hypothetical protein [Neorhodopirellula pilleata]|uniref:DUF3618 domain-containing protein n=1 Tax=Neorhodopirellula pilleata TaxID=2714738 RepID=A0A5C6AUF7_9BACT|nr:hypothetical protein [Neorhodopirellula pilleata]TWU03218.1 hypothetical protein Pla100_01360 [Neorhodopirellula pilleata]
MSNTLATKKQAAAIKQRMQEIRTQLPYDVDVARQSARELSDWRYHMGRYPWLLVGAAVVVGYVMVPHRKKSEVKVIHHDFGNQGDDALRPQPAKRGLIGGIGGAIATMAMKQAATVIAHQVSQRFSLPHEKSHDRH